MCYAQENVHRCRRMVVLYLYNNSLTRMDGLQRCSQLTHLYLQNNNIGRITGLGSLHGLTKLYLSKNRISVVEGLHTLKRLAELHVDHQDLPPGEKFVWDPRSVAAMSQSLVVLNTAGNGLDSLEAIAQFKQLAQLNITGNAIMYMQVRTSRDAHCRGPRRCGSPRRPRRTLPMCF